MNALHVVRNPAARGATVAAFALLLGACSGAGDSTATARCWVVPSSTLGRLPRDAGGERVTRGWIRLDGSARADSGTALLVDADGASMPGQWRRIPGDSVHIVAFNDFLRLEYRARAVDTTFLGALRATSDAAVERDSTGKLIGMDRRSEITGAATPCDSIPGVRNA